MPRAASSRARPLRLSIGAGSSGLLPSRSVGPEPAISSTPGHGPRPSGSSKVPARWDLPAAYPSGNFHTDNLEQFARDVEKASNGKLHIQVHANAALFKAPEIKRAVQGGQAQIGEILLVNFQNEWPIFGADGIPFLADSYDAAAKLWRAQKPFLDKKLGEQGMMVLYAVAWPPQ